MSEVQPTYGTTRKKGTDCDVFCALLKDLVDMYYGLTVRREETGPVEAAYRNMLRQAVELRRSLMFGDDQ